MRRVTADLRNIRTPAALQVYLGFALGAPEYYGRNLDALRDVLTERRQPLELTLLLPARFSPEMEAYWPRLRRVLDDAAEEARAFSWTGTREG